MFNVLYKKESMFLPSYKLPEMLLQALKKVFVNMREPLNVTYI